MKVPLYQVDAFTDRMFQGNPAAVCPLEAWLEDDVMQKIAAENNLSETAFMVPGEDHYDLRWFTPEAEIDLAGHPTLAAAFVILTILEPSRNQVDFMTPSGKLTVNGDGGLLSMNFPSRPGELVDMPALLAEGLGAKPREVLLSRDHLAIFESEEEIAAIRPRFDILSGLDSMGVIVSAPGVDVDFVSRFFAPKMGINEDPVTGSAHCTLVPYWSQRLGKKELRARQISKRTGELWCTNLGERVRIAGRAVLYMEGFISL